MAPNLQFIFFTLLSLSAPAAQFTRYEEDSCNLIGDPELYGAGVRISYYLACLPGIIALAFGNCKAVEDAKKGNAIIGFAMLIILIRNTVQGSLALFEWDLVFPMVFLLMSAAFLVLTFFGGIMSSAVLFIIYGLYAVLLPWIYFNLEDQGRRDECELKAFFFAYFDFYNVHWLGYLKAMSIMYAMSGVILIIGGFAVVIYSLSQPEKEDITDEDGEGVADEGDNGVNEDDSAKNDKIYAARGTAVLSLIVGAFTVAFTEKQITGNKVDLSEASFDSTNQLIPFLVGIATLLSTVGTCVKDKMKKAKVEKAKAEKAKAGIVMTERTD